MLWRRGCQREGLKVKGKGNAKEKGDAERKGDGQAVVSSGEPHRYSWVVVLGPHLLLSSCIGIVWSLCIFVISCCHLVVPHHCCVHVWFSHVVVVHGHWLIIMCGYWLVVTCSGHVIVPHHHMPGHVVVVLCLLGIHCCFTSHQSGGCLLAGDLVLLHCSCGDGPHWGGCGWLVWIVDC